MWLPSIHDRSLRFMSPAFSYSLEACLPYALQSDAKANSALASSVMPLSLCYHAFTITICNIMSWLHTVWCTVYNLLSGIISHCIHNSVGQLCQTKDSTGCCGHHVAMEWSPPPLEVSVSSLLHFRSHRRAIERMNYVVPSPDVYILWRTHEKANPLPCYICIKFMQSLYCIQQLAATNTWNKQFYKINWLI